MAPIESAAVKKIIKKKSNVWVGQLNNARRMSIVKEIKDITITGK